MLELLKNEIIVNWIAPIITGLIITGISSLKKNYNMITIILILLIVIAETMIIIINILDTGTVRPEENILYIIPLLLGIVSIMSGLIIIVLNSSESKLENIKKNNYESIYYNYINQKIRNNLREKNNKK